MRLDVPRAEASGGGEGAVADVERGFVLACEHVHLRHGAEGARVLDAVRVRLQEFDRSLVVGQRGCAIAHLPVDSADVALARPGGLGLAEANVRLERLRMVGDGLLEPSPMPEALGQLALRGRVERVAAPGPRFEGGPKVGRGLDERPAALGCPPRGARMDRRLLAVAGEREVAGQVQRDELQVVRVQFAHRIGDGSVEVGSLDVVEAVVDGTLDEVVPEPVGRHACAAAPPHAHGPNEAVRAAQLGAQREGDVALRYAQRARHHLDGELFALHGRDVEPATQIGRQALDAFADHAVDAIGDRGPANVGVDRPFASVVSNDLALVAHRAEQLHREERQAARLRVQRLSERRVEAIGFGVEVGVDEGAVFGSIERQHDVALEPTQFVDDLRERMAGAGATGVHVGAAEAAEHEHRRRAEEPSEVEQQVGRGAVDPLEIVQHEQERAAAR